MEAKVYKIVPRGTEGKNQRGVMFHVELWECEQDAVRGLWDGYVAADPGIASVAG